MYILYYNSYLVKGGVKITKKWLRGFCMTPNRYFFFQKSYKVGIIELVILGVSNVRTMI